MSEYTLCSSTSSAVVDRVLMAIVGRYERAFPNLIRAYFVIGSYADASMVPISDLDLMIMFAKPLTSDQLAQAHALIQQCAESSPLRLDIGLTLQHDLSGTEQVLLKLGSRLVYGEDMRDQLVLPPIAQYRRDVTWSPYRFLGQVMRDQQVLTYPLDYPNAGDPFYGYATKRLAAWYPTATEQGTKELITGVTRTATALLALCAGQYVGTKSASIRLYRYFQHYRAYLLELLRGTDDERPFAAQRLAQVVYTDAAVVGILQANTQTARAETRAASAQALAQIAQAQEGMLFPKGHVETPA